jgi:splicing factor 3B subunit 1
MTPQTPSLSGAMTPRMTPGGATPIGQKAMAMATPTPGHLVTMTPEQLQVIKALPVFMCYISNLSLIKLN